MQHQVSTLDHTLPPKGKSDVEIGQADTGILLFAFGLCAGAAIYLMLDFEPQLPLLAGLAGLFVFVLLAVRHLGSSEIAVLALVTLTGVTCGSLITKTHASMRGAPPIVAETPPVILEGWITSVEPGRNGARLRITPHAIAGVDSEKLPNAVRVTHRLSLNMEPGRFVRCLVILRPPPAPSVPGDADFGRAAWFEGLGAVGYVRGRCQGGSIGRPHRFADQIKIRVGEWRRQIGLYVKSAAGERAGGFAAALVSGDRSHLSLEDQEALRRSGLAHLLAISGLHMAIVGGLIYMMVFRGLALVAPLAIRFPVQKIAALAAILSSLVYLTISGASVSTQRAFIMALIVFSGIMLDRSAINLRGFALAMILVTILAPHSVVSPGFQMSFAATGVLIAIFEAWNRRRYKSPHLIQRTRFGRFVFATQSLVVTSVAASLATLPFAIYHFGRLAPFGILANLAAMPIVSFVTAPLAGLCLILSPFGVAEWALRAFGWSLEWILKIAHFGAAQAPDVETTGPIHLPEPAFLMFILALVTIVTFRGFWRFLGGAVFVCSAITIWLVQSMPAAYLTPAGDLILTDGPRKVQLFDGQGLSSLRYADLSQSEECAYDCNFKSAGLQIEIVEGPQRFSCSQDTSKLFIVKSAQQISNPDCRTLVRWADIQSTGGVAIYRTRAGSVRLKRLRNCTGRPWQTCQSQPNRSVE